MAEMSREFFIDKDGFKIHAKLDIPEGLQKFPLVIVVHGFTGHMEERHIIAVSEAARRTGMATLRVELYGHGQTDGRFEHHNILDWISEILYVIDYARSLSYITDLYLMGHSQGGLSIILAAALKADQLKAIIPLSPAIVIRDGCRDGCLLGHAFDKDHIPEKLEIGEGRHISGSYIRVGRVLPVEAAIDAYTRPVLIIHGTEDEAVPFRYGEMAAERYQNAKLVSIQGDDHCYNRHLDQVTKAVEEFLLEQNSKVQ